MTRRKISALFNFYCIFRFFGTRGVHCTKKKKKACSEASFFALKFSIFLSVFSTCLDMSSVGVDAVKL